MSSATDSGSMSYGTSIGSACAIEPRITQWSSSSADIRALRKIAQ